MTKAKERLEKILGVTNLIKDIPSVEVSSMDTKPYDEFGSIFLYRGLGDIAKELNCTIVVTDMKTSVTTKKYCVMIDDVEVYELGEEGRYEC